MNSNHIKAGVFMVSALILAQGVQAAQPTVAAKAVGEPASVAPSSSVYRQLDELRSQNAILAESLKNSELRNKIKDANKAPNINLTPGNAGTGHNSAQVQMVSGIGSNLVALISLPNGGVINARVGTKIPSIGVVKSISINEVVVANKSRNVVLPFVSDGYAPGQPAFSGYPSTPQGVPGGNPSMPGASLPMPGAPF